MHAPGPAPTFTATPGPALRHLLDQSLRFLPEYGNGLSSHLPMALAALDGLGASEARMQAFADAYTRRFALAPQQPAESVAAHDWFALRGRIESFPSLRATFAAALQRGSRDTVLHDLLPSLITGAGAAAFHGLIRTAHAVESRHDGELAAALAYWAARWSALPPPEASEPTIDSVPRWLAALDEHLTAREAGWRSTAPLIAERMRDATHTDAYRAVAGRLRTVDRDGATLLHDLALAAAMRYAATRNFTVLHMATGARAARVLAPWLSGNGAALASLAPLWHAVAAASLASGTTAGPPAGSASAALDWPQVRALAVQGNDDHVIKLVHAMAVQHAQAPHAAWLRAAAAAVAG